MYKQLVAQHKVFYIFLLFPNLVNNYKTLMVGFKIKEILNLSLHCLFFFLIPD